MKRVTLVLAAATAVGSMVAVGSAATTPAVSAKPNTAMTSQADIRTTVADMTGDALTKADLTQLIHLFSDADQKRIMASSTYSENYGTKLDSQIDQLSKNWKQKYGHTFQFTQVGGAIESDFATIQEGTAGHDSQLSSFVTKNSSGSAAKLAASQQIAEMDIKASGKSSEVKVPLICEGADQWRVNVPDTLTASRLRNNLTEQLSKVNSESANWPKDENQAYRVVARHVLMAVLDQGTSAKPQATAQPPAKPQATAAAAAAAPATSHWWQFWRGW